MSKINIVLVCIKKLPVSLYGGTERVVWGLGKELAALGHQVTFMAKAGSQSNFAKIVPVDETKDLISQIPPDTDFVHFHFTPNNLSAVSIPYLITEHGNRVTNQPFNINTNFVSQNHASRFGSACYVHNGLDWNEYSKPIYNNAKKYFHFLGKAAWRVKNFSGALDIVKAAHTQLAVIGGKRLNVNMGFRLTLSTRARFYGMIGGAAKDQVLQQSKGLIFPVRWHEPFGLALIESLYFGCPIFATPYGAIPEIVSKKEFGFLSNSKTQLAQAITDYSTYSPKYCSQYAQDVFNNKKMALAYLQLYETLLQGNKINNAVPQLVNPVENKFLDWNE